ncbi:hypothetical protein F4556_007262 [Kitasatospora gansuensis]|uniref:Uncharacterized protein n=1 Tax=Kitasatospora gansuensis TaxID=258050 RepID=A0A7W7SKF6_9ACTN|nr:hypothetical protein [Kitasatospora gansuensis]MBB4951727.1 hypothetical protein [Kitasatospora gansuensis]
MTREETNRRLVAALNPRRGYALLRFTESEDRSGFRWVKYGIKLTCFDPWFYSDEVRSESWDLDFGKVLPFLRSPFLPLTLSEGIEYVTDLPIDNAGDVEAWPVWKITGPVKSFSISTVPAEHSGSVQSFGIPAVQSGAPVIEAGRTLTIDSRPGGKSAAVQPVALYVSLGFWHRSWGVVAERYPVVRLRGDGFA